MNRGIIDLTKIIAVTSKIHTGCGAHIATCAVDNGSLLAKVKTT